MNAAGIEIPIVLNEIRPGAKWRMSGEEYSGLTWVDDGPGGLGKPSEADITNAWPAIAAAMAAKQADGEAQKANLISVYTAMFNGTGTTGERATRLEKSLCWIVRHNLNLVD